MRSLNLFYQQNKTIILFTLVVLVYLLLKSIFWPIQKNISARIIQQKGEIVTIDTLLNSNKKQYLLFDKIYFHEDDELFHDNTGYLGYENNFFIDLVTYIKVKKLAEYLFHVESDDGFRLIIDHQIVCEYRGGRAYGLTECPWQLAPGEHILQLNYYQGMGQMGLKLSYQTDQIKQSIVGENSENTQFYLKEKTFYNNHADDSQQTKKTELEQLIERAASGNSASQFKLADKYLSADGLQENKQKAFKWYKLSAENGEPYAQYQLGHLYSQGIGVSQNTQKAIYWLELSANKYYIDAQQYLGELYMQGKLVNQNKNKASYWFKKTAVADSESLQHPFFVNERLFE